MKRLNRIIRDNPEAVGPYRAVAAFMRITGKLTLAVQYFQNLLEEVPETVKPIVHLSLAELYASQGNMGELRKHRGSSGSISTQLIHSCKECCI